MNKAEMLHWTDVNNTHLHLYSAIAFPNQSIDNTEAMEDRVAHSYHHKRDDVQYVVFYNTILLTNLPTANDMDFFLFPGKEAKFISAWKKWRERHSVDDENIVARFEKVKKFHMTSFRLVDIFRFIIKIPDKWTTLSYNNIF
ncbi:hypothetical protein EG347_11390 [Chryseobacterium sp. G0186]|uniref:hypothetical protein n=1 Tax=Chryseobacterium sp. G0186 TaxID=2487064 RepID=UPI000F50B17B|nr:hypothetical protein [Chryseobacterium sp. G0186]AZA78078.1 hypothetical protein EG347_11390 [Chryseobacterium sp. G0186]